MYMTCIEIQLVNNRLTTRRTIGMWTEDLSVEINDDKKDNKILGM